MVQWQKAKVKLSLCLIKYHAMKTYLVPRREDILEWRYSSTHS